MNHRRRSGVHKRTVSQWPIPALLVFMVAAISFARESEGNRTNSILLNGAWEFSRGEGDENAETQAGRQKLRWEPIQLPGPFMRWSQKAVNNTKCVWACRKFTLTTAQ